MTSPDSSGEALPLALVTGAGRRLGRAIALEAARLGFAVVVHYHRSDAEARAAAGEIAARGGLAYPLQADLRLPPEISRLMEQVAQLPHPLRLLVNSAAAMPHTDVMSLTPAEWDDTLALNLRAPLLLTQAAANLMTGGGLIINITDAGAGKAWTGYPAYIVSKAGLEALTRLLGRALAPRIRVNAVAPGLVLPVEELPVEKWDRLIKKVPLGRAGTTQEICQAVAFLVRSEYITGEIITVDGGYRLI